MTEQEIKLARRLGHCSFQPGSWDKRFCRAMAKRAEHHPEKELSDKQREWLSKMAHRYRRQLNGGT